MSKRDTILLLDDMLQSARKIKSYTKDLNFDDFVTDEKTIEIINSNINSLRHSVSMFNHHKNIRIENKSRSSYRRK
jgi:uncharacterized protein with HEPN domain